MATTHPRVIRLVHSLPGRTRLRLPWLRTDPEAATALADHLSDLAGMLEVRVRPRTGSVLCRYRHPLDEERLIRAVRRQTHVATLVRPGDDLSHLRPVAALDAQRGSATVARAMARSASALNREVLEFTDGRLDLATLAALGFLTGGAVEIGVTRQLPVPTWFNLAWWAFRTFMQFEQEAVNGIDEPTATAPVHRAPTGAAKPKSARPTGKSAAVRGRGRAPAG